jgi:hypothetical protein
LARRWSKQLELVGAAGEAVDLRRINEEAWTLTTTLALARRATTLHIAPVPSGWARPTLEKAQPTP